MKEGVIAAASAVACMATVLALFAGNARATEDETTYKFRLVNNPSKPESASIRCGTSGSWTSINFGSTDKECSESTAQTKLGDAAATNWSHNCEAARPIKRIWYSGYWIGATYKSRLSVGCRAE